MERAPMTAWYAPLQLLRTGRDVAVSSLFGKSDDRRLFQHLAWREYAPYDLSQRSEIVVDYVADTGDGFDSTYAIQHWMTRPELELAVRGKKKKLSAPRGDVLVFGGDEVYPTPMGLGYEERLIAPMRAACGHDKPEKSESEGPWVFAIPGNHDWYDNLTAFTHVFITKKTFCMWHAPQRRSYFAIALPHGWWLLGTDVQLASELDDAQIEFFRDVSSKMGPSAKVILCNAEPHWIYEHDAGRAAETGNLFKLEQLIGRKVRVWIAGDLHHYRRFASDDGVQKITAGGGGAFLHPTHGWKRPPLEGGFHHERSFPSEAKSRAMTRKNLLFPFYNRTFGVLTAAVYALVGWNVLGALRSNPVWPDGPIADVAIAAVTRPAGATWYALVIVAFIVFTDTSKLLHRIVGGGLHAVAHLSTIIFGVWLSCFMQPRLDLYFQSPAHVLGTIALLLVLGAVVGPFWMGIYLYVSLNGFGRHRNEAFSALRIADFKNFLRMRIDPEGRLHIFPIGIERVPRRWKKKGRRWVPDDPNATVPELIEAPIVLDPK
jgi:hypothetical protein